LQNDVLDVILENLLPLALTLFVWWLLERRTPTMRLIGMLFVMGVLATYAGLLGSARSALFSRAWVDLLTGGSPVSLGSLFRHLWPVLAAAVAGGLGLLWSRRSDS
jgi:hypothetical protein